MGHEAHVVTLPPGNGKVGIIIMAAFREGMRLHGDSIQQKITKFDHLLPFSGEIFAIIGFSIIEIGKSEPESGRLI
jgi:hypothetical protein